jgi:hypothetical protein
MDLSQDRLILELELLGWDSIELERIWKEMVVA